MQGRSRHEDGPRANRAGVLLPTSTLAGVGMGTWARNVCHLVGTQDMGIDAGARGVSGRLCLRLVQTGDGARVGLAAMGQRGFQARCEVAGVHFLFWKNLNFRSRNFVRGCRRSAVVIPFACVGETCAVSSKKIGYGAHARGMSPFLLRALRTRAAVRVRTSVDRLFV
ncbi:hypothetical protein DFH06DRAFT_1234164 [Mycena polygramma]|nr:hypothetical protein DFH06DRAFT_1234164 [Mycena polygramma]